MPLQDTTFQRARWIIPQGAKNSSDGNRTAFFRLEMDLPNPLPEALRFALCMTAHTRYKLRINGEAVAVGPRKANENQWFYERLELEDRLVPGKNVLTAQVVSYAPLANPDNMGLSPISVLTLPLEPALLAAGGLFVGEELLLDATTGIARWQAVNLDDAVHWLRDRQTHYVGALEQWHAGRLPKGMYAGEQADWPDALDRWNPQMNEYGEFAPMRLTERTIPPMEERPCRFIRQMNGPEMPLAENGHIDIPADRTVAFELDAGELTTGYMVLAASGGEGARIRIRYAECYRYRDERGEWIKGVRDQRCEGGLDMAYDELLADGGRLAFESFWFRTFRFVRIEVETKGQPLRLAVPHYRRTNYPLQVRADVRSRQPWVEKLFEISARTLRCCMHETYEDCPFYEQLQYTSDTKLQMDFTYAASGDLRMARQVIEDYHQSLLPDGMLQSRTPSQHRQVIPQFALYFIHMLDALYQQDADADFLVRYRPTVDAILDYFDRHRDARGLVRDLGYWDFGDWVPSWRHGVPDAVWQGPSTIHNLAYAWTLQIAAKLASVSGRAALAAEYEARSGTVIDAVRSHCFDEASGLFFEGPGFAAYGQQAQAFAVLCGALEGEEARRALRSILAKEDAAKSSYPQQFYLLRALEKAGLYDLSEGIWQGLIDLLPLNITTLPETPEHPRSDCHAWSALPLYDAPRVWLGVRPTAPGWDGITVQPLFLRMLGDLEGSVPTPHGQVAVAWRRDGDQIALSIQSPADVPLTLALPGAAPTVHPQGGKIQATI